MNFTESQAIANAIHSFQTEEVDLRPLKEREFKIQDDVCLFLSKDESKWYLFKTLPDQYRYFVKTIATAEKDWQRIVQLLDSQGWTCF